MEPAAPKTRPIRFSLRRMFLVLTVIAVVVGLAAAGVRFMDSVIMEVERDAARQGVLERGSALDYDRWLLGAEVDALKAEYQKRKSEQTAK